MLGHAQRHPGLVTISSRSNFPGRPLTVSAAFLLQSHYARSPCRLWPDGGDRDPDEPQVLDTAVIDRQGIALAVGPTHKLQTSDRKGPGESVIADGLQIDVSPRIVNFKRTIANEHVIRNTQFGAVELALVGLEPLRRRLGDQDAPHRKACAILMEDSVLSLSAFRWVVEDNFFCRNHSKAEGGVGDCVHWKR